MKNDKKYQYTQGFLRSNGFYHKTSRTGLLIYLKLFYLDIPLGKSPKNMESYQACIILKVRF